MHILTFKRLFFNVHIFGKPHIFIAIPTTYIAKFEEYATLLEDALKIKDQNSIEIQHISTIDFDDSEMVLFHCRYAHIVM